MDLLVIIFIDDILDYSKSEEERETHFPTVLELLKEKQIYAKSSKYEFLLSLVSLLGHMVSKKGVMVYP